MAIAIVGPVRKVGRDVWQRVPAGLQQRRPIRIMGSWIHALARRFSKRTQSESTWFLRNLPLLMTVRDTLNEFGPGEALRICILGCSTGAEVYSVLYVLRKARRDLKILPLAIDISESAIAKAKSGQYGRHQSELRGPISEQQLLELFDGGPSDLKIRPWIAEAIDWRVGDACDDDLRAGIERQNIVFANNFLVHMNKRRAASCLRGIIQLVKPGGLLVCRGVDLDIRQRIVQEFNLEPVETRLEDIHDSEPTLDAQHGWPCSYWGLEPLDKTRPDWIERYTAIYRLPMTFVDNIDFKRVSNGKARTSK